MACSTIHFLSLFLLLPLLAMAKNVTLSSSLSTTGNNPPWLSPSGEFAFGFQQLNNTNLFLLAIWFDKIPDKTIVWHANGNNPAQSGSAVELTAGGLVLTDPRGQTIWKQEGVAAVAYAAMLDTGNFVLAGNNSINVWETFKNPTDTLLPPQTLDPGGMLFSQLSETNYSKGRFELHFSKDGLGLNPVAWPTDFPYSSYYSIPISTVNSSESGKQLVFNQSMNIYVVKMNGEILPLEWESRAPIPDYYYRATLDFNGVFTQYSHPRSSNANNQSWSIVRYVPNNICTAIENEIGRGSCGYNSYCSIMSNGRPECKCPSGYVFTDPNNEFGDCKPNFTPACGVDDASKDPVELFEMREMNGVNWPLGDYERLEPYNQMECELSCLYDCTCAVAIFGGTTCWKKRLPLSNGKYVAGDFSMALIKVRKGAPPSGSSDIPICDTKKEKSSLLVSIFLGSSVFFNVFLITISLLLFSRHKEKPKKAIQDSYVSETNLHLFTYKELEEATEGFQDELGRGSCGIVYKGVLKFGSKNLVAVKKLDRLAQESEKEFGTEVNAIGKTYHKNLVRLLGFCDEGTHRLLVYEFMSNGTLANFLFGLPKPDWNRRSRIALGIAGGLVYLHEECGGPIIHCDIKPQNILLDDYLTARISDFGLAKLLLSDQTRTRTGIRGTRGYVALEWFKNVPVTTKVDVYSFGVMLLEIICCRKSVELEVGEEEREILTDWAYNCYIEDRLDELVGNDEAMGDIGKLQRWVMIAIWCIQEDPSKRPTMKMVREMLEGFAEVPVPPCPFSFSSDC